MKKYIGTKELKATPMTLGVYNEYRGWKLPEDEDPNTEGYLVEYIDGGKPNDKRHEGYISWSPKDVFEKAYKVANTPLDRMYIEYKELMDKHNKLVLFLGRKDAVEIAGKNQVALMEVQKVQMHDYLLTLKERIDLMKK